MNDKSPPDRQAQETLRTGWGEGVRRGPAGCAGGPGVPGTYQPHLAFRTLVLQVDVMQAHVALVRPCARDVAAHAADNGDATQPALIGRRSSRVHAWRGARALRLTQRCLDQAGVLLVQPRPLNCCQQLRHALPPWSRWRLHAGSGHARCRARCRARGRWPSIRARSLAGGSPRAASRCTRAWR